MRRFLLGCALLALVAVGAQIVDAQASVTTRRPVRPSVDLSPPTRVALYGDSLASESRAAFAARMIERSPSAAGDEVTVSTFPGTALCDYRAEIVADLTTRRPQVIVLEFSGNSLTECMRNERGANLRIGSDGWRDRYLDDLHAIVKVANATDTTVVWGTAPPVDTPGSPTDYPRRITGAVRALAERTPNLEVADTGAALTTDGHSYRPTLPCRSDEREICTDGHVVVRSDDRLHFDCHGALAVRTTCDGYSAGARRYGEALADAALAAG